MTFLYHFCTAASVPRYLDQYQKVREENAVTEEEVTEKLSGNPLHVFLLAKRLSVDWPRVEQLCSTNPWESKQRRRQEYVVDNYHVYGGNVCRYSVCGRTMC